MLSCRLSVLTSPGGGVLLTVSNRAPPALERLGENTLHEPLCGCGFQGLPTSHSPAAWEQRDLLEKAVIRANPTGPLGPWWDAPGSFENPKGWVLTSMSSLVLTYPFTFKICTWEYKDLFSRTQTFTQFTVNKKYYGYFPKIENPSHSHPTSHRCSVKAYAFPSILLFEMLAHLEV